MGSQARRQVGESVCAAEAYTSVVKSPVPLSLTACALTGALACALLVGCERPFVARDGTVSFQEKGNGHGASVLTANGVDFGLLEAERVRSLCASTAFRTQRRHGGTC